ncbi:MAG TPA: biotin/lipoyl-binding protein, partial [Verrucomicrobiae bacterium]
MKTLPKSWVRPAVTLSAVIVAILVGRLVWNYYMNDPWTRDGRVCADVVRVAPDVSGVISEVLVHDNQTVHQGEVLFRVDQERFKLALQQREAILASAEAALELARREANRYQRLENSNAA